MSKITNIKPPIWPKELTFEDFKKLNPLINENQIINLYNQYLNKFLTELAELKTHYKQSLNKNLQLELKSFQQKQNQILSYYPQNGGAYLTSSSLNTGAEGDEVDNSIKASGRIRLRINNYNEPEFTEELINELTASISNQNIYLRDTLGTQTEYRTPRVTLAEPNFLSRESMELWSSTLVGTINDLDISEAFTASYASTSDDSIIDVAIRITQTVGGSAGNNEIEGTLEESSYITYVHFSGGVGTAV